MIRTPARLLACLLPVAAALALPSVAGAAVTRITNTPPALILQGVTVSSGSEMLYLSGQLAAPITAGKMDSIEAFGDTKTQTISTFTKIKGILAAKGYKMSDIIKLTVFVAGDPKLGGKMDFAGMNEGYKMFFGTAENPNLVARSTVQVAALAGPYFLVEIEATAAK